MIDVVPDIVRRDPLTGLPRNTKSHFGHQSVRSRGQFQPLGGLLERIESRQPEQQEFAFNWHEREGVIV